jgi:hypothetical protein
VLWKSPNVAGANAVLNPSPMLVVGRRFCSTFVSPRSLAPQPSAPAHPRARCIAAPSARRCWMHTDSVAHLNGNETCLLRLFRLGHRR